MQLRFEEKSAMDLRSLRFLVLWPHQPTMEKCLLEGDFLPQTKHFAAINELNVIVACCTIMAEAKLIHGQEYPLRLRAMASHPDVRGSGAARRLLDFALSHFIEQDFWCDAREVAVGFYQKCGWKVQSSAYEIPIIGTHFLMTRS